MDIYINLYSREDVGVYIDPDTSLPRGGVIPPNARSLGVSDTYYTPVYYKVPLSSIIAHGTRLDVLPPEAEGLLFQCLDMISPDAEAGEE